MQYIQIKNKEKGFYSESVQRLEEVACRDCGISILGYIQNLNGYITEQSALVDPAKTRKVVDEGKAADIVKGLIDNVQRSLPTPVIP